jgi:hypothetical protein
MKPLGRDSLLYAACIAAATLLLYFCTLVPLSVGWLLYFSPWFSSVAINAFRDGNPSAGVIGMITVGAFALVNAYVRHFVLSRFGRPIVAKAVSLFVMQWVLVCLANAVMALRYGYWKRLLVYPDPPIAPGVLIPALMLTLVAMAWDVAPAAVRAIARVLASPRPRAARSPVEGGSGLNLQVLARFVVVLGVGFLAYSGYQYATNQPVHFDSSKSESFMGGRNDIGNWLGVQSENMVRDARRQEARKPAMWGAIIVFGGVALAFSARRTP